MSTHKRSPHWVLSFWGNLILISCWNWEAECMRVCMGGWICYRDKKKAFLNFWKRYFNFKKSCKINCLHWEKQGHWITKSSCLATQKTHFISRSPLWKWRVRWIVSFDDHNQASLEGPHYNHSGCRRWAIFLVEWKNIRLIMQYLYWSLSDDPIFSSTHVKFGIN